MLRSKIIAVAVTAGLVSVLTSQASAQALADRVPADAIAYFGWAGADSIGAASEGTHLAAILAESRARELFGSYLDQVEEKIVASSPDAREPFRIFRTFARPMWRFPTAFSVGAPAFTEAGKPIPRVMLLTRAGADAPAMVAELEKLVAEIKSPPFPIQAFSADEIVCLSVGYGSPEIKAFGVKGGLAGDAAFKQAIAKLSNSPMTVGYLNVEASLATISDVVEREAPESLVKWSAFVDASGLKGVRRLVSTSGFEGKDWVSQSFVDAPSPRAGLLTIFGEGPASDELLKAVPADASFFTTGKFDAAKAVREVQNSLGKTDPELLKNFNYGLGAIYQAAGTNVLTNVLDPLGTDWAVYNSPRVGSNGLLGAVLVNQLDDATKLQRNLMIASVNLTNWINIGVRKATGGSSDTPTFSIHGAKTKIGDVEVNYLATPMITPAWVIANGRLYLGFYPQTVGAAVRQADVAGKSILDNADYQATLKRLGVDTPMTTSYTDLPKLAAYGSWYPHLLGLSRYAGFGDLFGLTFPEPFVPPMDTLMDHMTPAASASWSDASGFHSKQVVPFPGATLLTEPATLSQLSGPSNAALVTSILLPSLNRARETANRVKSASNLKQIGLAMLLYSNENRNRYPDDFGQLLATQDLLPDVFISPRTDTTLPEDFEEQKRFIVQNSDYVYLGKGLTNASPAEVVLAYENPDALEDGVNVLFGDGHVEFILMAELDELLERQQALRVQP